jgi:hypothetical protein
MLWVGFAILALLAALLFYSIFSISAEQDEEAARWERELRESETENRRVA